MKRSTPLQRRSPLRTRSSLSRRTRLNQRSKTNSYRKRPRDIEYMRWVKRQPCILRSLHPCYFRAWARFSVATRAPAESTFCTGVVEADHMGARGMGQKADDRTCVPMCSHHHRARHDHSHDFKHLTRDELRAWRTAAIERTQEAWRNR